MKGPFGRTLKKTSLFTSVNLAAFASTGIARTTQSFPLQNKYGSKAKPLSEQPSLRLTIACTWINDMEPDKSGYSSCSSNRSLPDEAEESAAGPGAGRGLARPVSLSVDTSNRRSRGNSADSRSGNTTPGGSSANGSALAAVSPMSASAVGAAAVAAAQAASLTLQTPRRRSEYVLCPSSLCCCCYMLTASLLCLCSENGIDSK